MMTGSLSQKKKIKKKKNYKKKKRGCSLIRACSLIRSNTVWPVITTSPRGQCSQYNIIQNFEGKACSDEKTVPVTWSNEKLISSYCIVPVGD